LYRHIQQWNRSILVRREEKLLEVVGLVGMLARTMKISLRLVFVLYFVLAMGLAYGAAASEKLPNVVIIYADDMGYGDLHCYGAKDIKTPNLDRLAKQGRRFTSFHVAQAVCSASRAALLTGCYPNRIGIHGALGPNAKVGISSNETTIAEMLKKRGYATGMAGKWHLGHHKQFLPAHHGFDEYLGLPYSNDMWPHHPEAKPGTYPPLPLIADDGVSDPDISAEDQVGLTTLYTERAVDFISRKKDGPFFFYLAYAMPHVPLFVSEKYKGKSKHGLYGDVIMEIDWSVGEVMKALEKAGVAKNTLVIFASDNGPWLSYGNHAGSPGPLREGKGTSWEGGVRVPGIVRWPGHVPKGTTSDAFWMTIDVLPTLAAITGAELPKQTIDGRNVLSLLEPAPRVRCGFPLFRGHNIGGFVFNPHEGYAIYYEVNQLQSVVSGDGRWKLVLPHSYRTLVGAGGTNGIPSKYKQVELKKTALYDLKNDVGEKRDVSDQHPDVVEKLAGFAEKMRAELGDALTKRNGSGSREPGRVAE
jgi:arylsulfatase A